MKSIPTQTLILLLCITSCIQQESPVLKSSFQVEVLIPQPDTIKSYAARAYDLRETQYIYYDQSLVGEAEYLKDQSLNWGISKVELVSGTSGFARGITLKRDENLKNQEAYALSIGPNGINIIGASAAGVMHGIQSLNQIILLNDKSDRLLVPILELEDAPAFSHRGLLLDVCRHFFSAEVLKKYVDLLALYKMNVLHLHLTEDQGWRIESKAYPKLNEISSWRKEDEGSVYGGFYTQEELKDLVKYAAQRHITIIPEIELPGHSQAALAAYPEFSCLGKDAKIEVANDWGVFKEIYCAGNDGTFTFLETILTEVMEIFPSEYIHIGGDEAPKYRWEHCDKCQQRIVDEGLADEHELQSYFIERIEKFLNKKGRKLIGWDEILEGGLSENATVQSWRGVEGGISAAEMGHQVIMSPTSHCYLDYGLDRIDVGKIYSFNPIPETLDSSKYRFVLGAECNMWTEYVPNERVLDQKVNPRMQALAEVLWSYPQERDLHDFYRRLQFHYPMLDSLQVEYGPETVPASIYSEVNIDSGKVFIGAKRNLDLLDMTVVWNGNKGPWVFNLKESGLLEAQATKLGNPYGDSISQSFAFHRALACSVDYQNSYEKWYSAGGDVALVNGTLGSLNFRDGQWQGFSGQDASLIIDLKQEINVEEVKANFYHYNNAWIFRPESFKVEASGDQKDWVMLGVDPAKTSASQRGKSIETFSVSTKKKARYLRITAKNIGEVPNWHEAAGSKAWVFIDEIIVN